MSDRRAHFAMVNTATQRPGKFGGTFFVPAPKRRSLLDTRLADLACAIGVGLGFAGLLAHAAGLI